MQDNPLKLAMIGLGTVGQGVAKLLTENAEVYADRLGRRVELKRVLVRDQSKALATGLVTAEQLVDDPQQLFADDIDAVVEVAGGLGPIETLVRQALSSGKHVITANKALLAAKGPELFALAREHGVSLGFEASCAGGIPCIGALTQGLTASRIDRLVGILNGTCNFILTQMTQKGMGYDEALKLAQELGFAEADPAMDVTGKDAAQKLAILASLAFGKQVPEEAVEHIGIDGLDLTDLDYGQELGYDIKLLGVAQRSEDGSAEALGLHVEPCFIKMDHVLAQVRDAFNALVIDSDPLGQVLLYGQGAGQGPTASAVVADILSLAADVTPQAFAANRFTPDLCSQAQALSDEQSYGRFYLRLHALDRPGTIASVAKALGDHDISMSAITQHEHDQGQFVPVVATTGRCTRAQIKQAVQVLAGLDVIEGQPVVIRILES